MTKRQKQVLIVMAMVDLLVVVGLGAYALAHRGLSPGTSAARETPLPRLSPCVAFLLESAERAGWTARVSESDTTVLYEVTMAASQAAFATEADSQAGSQADAVWSVLDSLSPEYADVCGRWETVVLNVIVANGAGSSGAVTAELQAVALARWLQGTLSDSELAAQTRYRSAVTALPQVLSR